MPTEQADLFGAGPSHRFPDGFQYHENAITVDEEAAFIEQLTVLPFKEFQFHGFEGKRRVVSFGWRYDFSEHKLSKADPIPAFLMDSYIKVQSASGFAMRDVQQALVTEYTPGAGIGWHKDRPVFSEVMAASFCPSRSALSLLFRRPGTVGMGTQHSTGRNPPIFRHFQRPAAHAPGIRATHQAIVGRNAASAKQQ
jgi:hypothetical protein